ncbi:MAG: Ig-like domain-containing protein, partial [Stenotrophomonas sp.]
MAVIVSVVSGGSVVGARQLGGAKQGIARISAVEGARYVLADTLGGGAAAGVTIKRVGRNLVIGQTSEGAEQDALVIEEFYGSGGQLVAQAADGSYQDYVAVTENGAIDAAQLSDGASSMLTLLAPQQAALAGEFQFSEGGSSLFASALASAAAVAGGIALSTGKSGGSKASAKPMASALVLEDQVAGVAADQPMPVAVEPAVAVVNDIASDAGNNPTVEPKLEMEAKAANTKGSNGAAAAIAPFGVDDIPVIDNVMDDHGVIQGAIGNGGYTDDGYPTITGKAEPGVKVHIYRNNYLLNYVVADAKGEWSYTPTLPFVTGKHSITIVHEYQDGEVSEQSAPYVITVDKVPPAIPVITGIVDDEGRITGAITDQTITDDSRPTVTGM